MNPQRIQYRTIILLALVPGILLLMLTVIMAPIPAQADQPDPRAGSAAPEAVNVTATIQVKTNITRALSARLRGTNAPAWLGANYQNNTLRARTQSSGVSFVRIPGGSWSDMYGWLSCEMRQFKFQKAYPCGGDGANWSGWITRPTDFINFLRATGKPGMYVININATPQEAAAAVAFFNALPTNPTPIGVDINAMNWYTAGHWAQLRVNHGNPQPLGIKHWEIGNEVYGGKPGSGKDCVAWGWEHTWTCDGTEYVNGIPGHAGYRAIRQAMKAVDPTILVGAVGIENPADYNNWGNEVIAAAGRYMDFYSVHPYAYYDLPPNTAAGYAQILAKPRQWWLQVKSAAQAAFNQHAGGRQIPIYATEYNLVSVQDKDTNQFMIRALNALFIAESIGQAMQNGFAAANQWDLANGCAGNGTCYDLLQVDHGFKRAPQYYVFPLWARFGNTMLGVTSTLNPSSQLSVYAGRVNATTYSLLAINKTGGTLRGVITFDNGATIARGSVYSVRAGSLTATDVTYNGVANPNDALTNAPPTALTSTGQRVTYDFPPYSITLLRMNTP